jgi:hypothetical protein
MPADFYGSLLMGAISVGSLNVAFMGWLVSQFHSVDKRLAVVEDQTRRDKT